MSPNHFTFPLRWESTGYQWWYASPIDFAASNGLYNVVKNLLQFDPNLLIKLTSLTRIRRLETLWDDESQFNSIAKSRARVAKNLLIDHETKRGENSLIRAGYGGWLLYTAASAGDLNFVMELLERDPFLIFGEGEYGVTDMFYAAARSKDSEVFRVVLEFAVSVRGCFEVGLDFKSETINRAVHAAARAGNSEILKELLVDCSDVLVYRDCQGSTILHSASGRGQLEVVKNLVTSLDIISSTDSQGNTALHIAAYYGYLSVVRFLILECPAISTLPNNYGDTFLHTAVASFQTTTFQEINREMEFMKQLTADKFLNIQDIINIRNNDGITALHMAVIDNNNIHSNLVELLVSMPSINLNIRDANGMTPLDHLKQQPRSACSEILIKKLISAGGISDRYDYPTRGTVFSHLKMHGVGINPGTSFKISDSEIFMYITGIENASDSGCDASDSCCNVTSREDNAFSGELRRYNLENSSESTKKHGAVNYGSRRMKFPLHWPAKKEKKTDKNKWENDDLKLLKVCKCIEDSPIPLRRMYSKPSSLRKNIRAGSPSSTLSVSSISPSTSIDKQRVPGIVEMSCLEKW